MRRFIFRSITCMNLYSNLRLTWWLLWNSWLKPFWHKKNNFCLSYAGFLLKALQSSSHIFRIVSIFCFKPVSISYVFLMPVGHRFSESQQLRICVPTTNKCKNKKERVLRTLLPQVLLRHGSNVFRSRLRPLALTLLISSYWSGRLGIAILVSSSPLRKFCAYPSQNRVRMMFKFLWTMHWHGAKHSLWNLLNLTT